MTISSELWSNCETNSVVVSIEVWVILSHEDISEDDIVEGRGESRSHDSVDAFGDSIWFDWDNVVLIGEDVVNAVNSECDVWESLNILAKSVDGDAFDQWVNKFLRTNNDWSSWVNDCQVFGHVNGGFTGLLHWGELEWPVFLFNNVMELHFSVECSLFIAWDGHVTGFGVVMEIEGKAFIGKITGINKGREVINWDGTISKSQNTWHLWGIESNTFYSSNFTKSEVLWNNIS